MDTNRHSEERTATKNLSTRISHNLCLSDGPKPQREVMEKLRAAGVGESTAKKAKQLLGVRSVKAGAVWLWSMPDGDGL